MNPLTITPGARPGAVVTVAFLKAQLDGGSDHLGMFMPLLLDVLPRIATDSLVAADIKEAIASRHGIAIPQETIATLLRRAVGSGVLRRDSGRYWKLDKARIPSPDVSSAISAIEDSQASLAEALRSHARRRGVEFPNADTALEALFLFLEMEQVGLLLRAPPRRHAMVGDAISNAVIAEFIQDVVSADPALASVLARILEGLVLYNAAFLPNLNAASRRFEDLTVVFDSTLVRQALGYEGLAAKTLMRETLEVLKGTGVTCLVFDQTVQEIHRILAMFEKRIGSDEGRRRLRTGPMTRHLLTQRYSPSDLREMSALLETEISNVGFRVQRTPTRTPRFTSNESSLAKRFADPTTRDDQEPRVVHDVDCVAGVLSLRRGQRSESIENARAVFATSSPLLIQNARAWWEEDEHETGVSPVVHIRALANFAWLKRPQLCQDFKLRELVALCAAALKPAQATWDRFIRHLEELHQSGRLTSDEVAAIMVSSMSDRLLKDAELSDEDPRDIDATTLDEVIDRVKESYAEESRELLASVKGDLQEKIEALSDKERAAVRRAENAEAASSEAARRADMILDGRVGFWAKCARWAAQGVVTVVAVSGALALFLDHHTSAGWVGQGAATAILIFVVLELIGIVHHIRSLGQIVEAYARTVVRRRLDPPSDAPNPWQR